jgi:hypothetical protein
MVTGESVDISEYLDFGFYDWIWYRDNAGLGETKLGRWLGVSHQVGPLMSFWILTAGAQVLSRTTVQRVTNLELQVVETIARCRVYDNQISDRLGDAEHYLDGDGKVTPSDWVTAHGHDPEFQEEFQKVINASDVPEADVGFTPDVFEDTYLNMELTLPRGGGEVELGRVVKRLRDKNGLPIGTAHDNPVLDSRIYEVEFSDGHRASLAANVIAENLFAQVDPEGHRHVLFSEILDHRTNGEEFKQEDGFIVTSMGTRRRKETT